MSTYGFLPIVTQQVEHRARTLGRGWSGLRRGFVLLLVSFGSSVLFGSFGS